MHIQKKLGPIGIWPDDVDEVPHGGGNQKNYTFPNIGWLTRLITFC